MLWAFWFQARMICTVRRKPEISVQLWTRLPLALRRENIKYPRICIIPFYLDYDFIKLPVPLAYLNKENN